MLAHNDVEDKPGVKSVFSNPSGNCVYVLRLKNGKIGLYESEQATRVILELTDAQYRTLLSAAKNSLIGPDTKMPLKVGVLSITQNSDEVVITARRQGLVVTSVANWRAFVQGLKDDPALTDVLEAAPAMALAS